MCSLMMISDMLSKHVGAVKDLVICSEMQFNSKEICT